MKFFNKTKKAKDKKPYIKLSKIEKITFSILIFIHIVFTVFVVYLLQTPTNEWVYNLGQYNTQLLELFPKAQNWVNNSPVFREKLILIYAIYRPLLWAMLIMMSVVMLIQYKRYTNKQIISIGSYCHNMKKLIFGILFIGFMVYGTFFLVGQGSEVVKSLEELDRSGRANEFRTYNTISGIYIYRALIGIGAASVFTYGLFLLIYQLIFCIKQRRIK